MTHNTARPRTVGRNKYSLAFPHAPYCSPAPDNSHRIEQNENRHPPFPDPPRRCWPGGRVRPRATGRPSSRRDDHEGTVPLGGGGVPALGGDGSGRAAGILGGGTGGRILLEVREGGRQDGQSDQLRQHVECEGR